MGKAWVLKRKCVNGKVRPAAGGMERTQRGAGAAVKRIYSLQHSPWV